MIVQIYGVTTPDDAVAVAELGVDRIGLVLCEDESLTHDGISFTEAREIIAAVPPEMTVCGLTFSTDVDEIEDMMRSVEPDILHLTVSPSMFPLERIRTLQKRLPGLKIMQAIPVVGPESIDMALEFQSVAESILLDTPRIGSTAIGATGRTHDWSVSRQIVQRVSVPVILAGGLSPANVAEAIRLVRPWGVDSSTLTSNPADMRFKDLDLVRRFVEEAKSAL